MSRPVTSKPMSPGVTVGPRPVGRKIVAVKADVEHARIHRMLLDLRDQRAQPLGQRNAAALDADQPDVVAAIVLFDDLVRQPHQRALDLGGRHQPALFAYLRLLVFP